MSTENAAPAKMGNYRWGIIALLFIAIALLKQLTPIAPVGKTG